MTAPDTADEFALAVGARVRAAREDAGMSQEVLGVEVNLSRESVSNVERGLHFRLSTIARIARAVGVPLRSLMNVWDGAI